MKNYGHCILCGNGVYCIFLKVCLIFFSKILSFSSRIFMKGICVVALAPSVVIMKESSFHPFF